MITTDFVGTDGGNLFEASDFDLETPLKLAPSRSFQAWGPSSGIADAVLCWIDKKN